MEDIIVELTSTTSFAIAMFGATFCLMQTKYSAVSRAFAAFLGVVALNNFPDAFGRLIEALPPVVGPVIDFATWPSSFLLAPLFWIYVFTLTSPEQRRPARLARHFVLPGLSVAVALCILVAPPDVRNALASDEGDIETGWTMALVVAAGLLQISLYHQIAFYLILIVRRLMTFRLKLRDVYASTEKHELRWIYVVCGLSGLFWLAQTVLLFVVIGHVDAKAPPAFLIIASLVSVVLVAALVLWGLRQRPPLVPDPDPPETPAQTVSRTATKYEKSALNAEASKRLSRKLRSAMEVDRLYEDPNLSLWALARHTGASPNYISQTLNEEIGESFFDFVNGYRVAEAKTLLQTTDKSVLTITYDVGFNARSSFYNAFKRVTGETPSKYRKNVSA